MRVFIQFAFFLLISSSYLSGSDFGYESARECKKCSNFKGEGYKILCVNNRDIVDDAVASGFKSSELLAVSTVMSGLSKDKRAESCSYLDLSNNTLLDASVNIVKTCIDKFPKLQILNLDWNRIQVAGLRELVDILKIPCITYVCVVGNYCSALESIVEVGRELENRDLLYKLIFISELRLLNFKENYRELTQQYRQDFDENFWRKVIEIHGVFYAMDRTDD